MVSLPTSPTSIRRFGGSKRSHSSSISLKTIALWCTTAVLSIYWTGVVCFFGAHSVSSGSEQRNLRAIVSVTDKTLLDVKSDAKPTAEQVAQNSKLNVINNNVQPNSPFTDPKDPAKQKYIMYVPITDGQGLGNLMNGLLAAHLLADEFHRRLCVSTAFTEFHLAFQPLQDGILEECALLPQSELDHPFISLINYGDPPDECALRDRLASATATIFYVGNTYPRWPVVPERYFATLYRPRQELLATLPWTSPPETVVHLRQPDPDGDHRDGLDDATLQLLGETLPGDTFLVTNRVEWYDLFETKYGWSHPEWEEVSHSAHFVSWGARNRNPSVEDSELLTKLSLEDRRKLQMVSDWYTISQGKHVVHTHSDFSLSGIHFMNIHNSQTILGLDENNKLKLVEESWRRDGETPRLIDRTPDNLRLCNVPPALIN